MKKLFTLRALLSALVLITSIQTGWSQIVYSGAASCVSGSSSTWLTAANWCGGVLPGATTYAQFAANGTATTIGFNMNGVSAANKTIGAIEIASTNTITRTLNNSSTTVSGAVVLTGVLVNSNINTVLRNNSSTTFTISNGSSQAFGISLGNTTNNIIYIDGTGGITINCVIRDSSGGAKKLTLAGLGTGVLSLTGANTYSGGTNITSGTLQVSASGVLADAGAITLNGGTLKTGSTIGFTETVSTLTLSDNSTIALGTGSHSLNFAASNSISWTSGKNLTITGWSGTNGSSGTAGKMFIGSNASGLSASQLAQIRFYDGTSYTSATILSTGEVVPASAASSDATLSSLTLSSGTLTPAFTSNTTTYTASVPNSVTSITVTPTVTESNATIKVNGTTVTSGSASGSISLNQGDNIITTVVTAQDGTTIKTYTVTVNRAAAGTPILTATAPTDFGNVCINNTAGPNSFTIDGNNLDVTAINIGALTGYMYAETSGGTYTTSLSFTYTGSSFSGKTIYVKFTPTAMQSYNGNIVVSGGGAPSINVAVTGSGINTAPSVTTGGATNIKATTASINATINGSGCTTISNYGFFYSPSSGFQNGQGTRVVSSNLSGGNYSSDISGLVPNTRYFLQSICNKWN